MTTPDLTAAATAATRRRCAELAVTTAERLLSVDSVVAGLPNHDHGSMAGLSATALLHARLAATDTRFAAAAHDHWAHAVSRTRGSIANSSAAGTFTSLGAVATSLILGSAYLPQSEHLRAATANATTWLSTRAYALAQQHSTDRDATATITPWRVYDTISGLAGVGRILLAAAQLGHSQALDGLCASLTRLTSLINEPGPRERPGWWLPADQHPSGATIPPTGAATTGLAHGIAGPLSLLSTAISSGHSVSGQATAIRRAAQWIMRWQEPYPGSSWPPCVSGAELDLDTAVVRQGRRTAWCYGTPGISRALLLAARAIADDKLTVAANTAIATLAAGPPHPWDVEGPTICHGHAGILQSVGHPSIAEQAAAGIIMNFDPQHPFCFQHCERRSVADNPGLLTGASGIALVLADHGHLPAPDIAVSWDSILLLS